MPASQYGVVHGLAKCDNCGWQSGSYKNIQAVAANHAKATGHVVQGEVAYMFVYGGK